MSLRDQVSWEVLEVVGDDHAGAADDGGREHVLVIGIGQSEGSLEGLPAGDQGVVEVGAHIIQQTVGLRKRGIPLDSAVDQLVLLVAVRFFEDRLTPQRSVEPFDGHRKQEVPLQAQTS
jgi:hypothetical protein